ncbi:hypothetical protein [Leptolyngbya sp. FACHB-261]|uniref:hypothetical protein n=1 Tax=Leptolyngbya sp. FACHB-261 TaxID=2692806 RepID=UPI001688E654|nr:hypothetical protein [Leptolyngbya sp. FACHB-261]MBD2103289.1 hypothetical protein [Leptolyngbya sp. FACHB-261]
MVPLPEHYRRYIRPSQSKDGSALHGAQSTMPKLPTELSTLWARKYLEEVASRSQVLDQGQGRPVIDLVAADSPERRAAISDKILQELPFAVSRSLTLAHSLLANELRRQGINPRHLDPWQLSADNRTLLELVIENFCAGHTPEHLSAKGSRVFGQVRRNCTREDGRILGFFSLQLHHTILDLLNQLEPGERFTIAPYLKVMDDHINIPLQDAYQAAAKHDLGSPALLAVQALLPQCTLIAQQACLQVRRRFSNHRTYTGSLRELSVANSSLRDAEMFIVYLCLCVLEEDISSIQGELFPLCIMLYPTLKVSWDLVREMLWSVVQQMSERLSTEHLQIFAPYLRLLNQLFSPELLHTNP